MDKDTFVDIKGVNTGRETPSTNNTEEAGFFGKLFDMFQRHYVDSSQFIVQRNLRSSNTEGSKIEFIYPEGYEAPIIDTPLDDAGNPVFFKTPKGNPEVEFSIKANKNIKNKTPEELINELKILDKNGLMQVQKELALEGYYDIDLSKGRSQNAYTIQNLLVQNKYLSKDDRDGNIGRQTIGQLQQMLIDEGYLPEKTKEGKPNKDGVLGKRTREAFKQYYRDYNVDGVLGDKTIKSYLDKELISDENTGFNTVVSAEGMADQCAAWVTKKYDVVTGDQSRQCGVFGNAWTMLKNIEDHGGTMLFNIYNNEDFDNVTDARSLKRATEKNIRNVNMNFKDLQAGDVVGIYVPSSSHHIDVLDGGTTYNTHVGIVVDVEDGVPIIEHNISGRVRREKATNLTGSVYGKTAITVAARPRQGEAVRGVMDFQDIKSNLKYPEKYKNELMDEYVDALASSKDLYKNIFPTVDLNFVEKAAIAITKRETNFMTRKQSDVKKDFNSIADMASAHLRSAWLWATDTPEESRSRDLTKMKFSSLPMNYRTAIGLTDPEQLDEDPTIAGRAVMLFLAKNYEYFSRLAQENPKLGLTKEDIENATILSYNIGLGKLSSLGFNPDGSFNPDELLYLRVSANPKIRERNMSATNWKHLSKIGMEGLGEFLYTNTSAYENGIKPYLASAREQIDILNALNNM